MPYLHLSVSPKLDEEKITAIHKAVAETITIIPGKSYQVTTIHINDGQCISLADRSVPCGFCDIRLFGSAPIGSKRDFAKAFTARITEITGIPAAHFSINMLELETWGRNGDVKSFR